MDESYSIKELKALAELKELLESSITAAKRGEFATAITMEEIIAEAKAEYVIKCAAGLPIDHE